MNQTVDFKIWSRQASEEDLRLPKINDCVYELIEQKSVSFDEIPANVLLSVDGITSLTHMRLSQCESETALGYARKYALKLANTLEGVLEESGADLVYCTEKLLPPQVTEYTSMLTLSVWFAGEKSFSDLYGEILSILEKEFPLALPSRYGESMPPEHEYTDKACFIEFLKNTPAPVWYAQRPVTHVHINDARRTDVKREGLRVDRISIRMPDALYEVEEWKFALRRLLKSLTIACGGFFGQICREESGVVSWWWQGVPLELGVACTFGEPYYSLIPDCAEKGEAIGEKFAYFEEPNGPYVPKELISVPKKKIIGKNRLYPDDFTLAANMPIEKK